MAKSDLPRIKCDLCAYVCDTEEGIILHQHVRHYHGGLRTLEICRDRKRDKANPIVLKTIAIRNSMVNDITKDGTIVDFESSSSNALLDVYIDEYGETYVNTVKGVRKICGAHKQGNSLGIYKNHSLCIMNAGHGTNHNGFGRCKFHQGNSQGSSSSLGPTFLASYMNQPAHSLYESLQKISKIASAELYDTETILRTLYILLDNQLREGQTAVRCESCGHTAFYKFEKDEMEHIRATIKRIESVIRADADMRSKLIIDPLGIWMFLTGVMNVVMMHLKKEERAEVAEEILNNVILPLGDKSSIAVKDILKMRPESDMPIENAEFVEGDDE